MIEMVGSIFSLPKRFKTRSVGPHRRFCVIILHRNRRAARLRHESDDSSGQQSAHGEYQVAERFELFYEGVELANGYHELLDPAVLRVRNELNNRASR